MGYGALGIPSLRDATRTASLRASGHWALGIHWAQKKGSRDSRGRGAEEKKLVQQLSPSPHLPIPLLPLSLRYET